MRNGTRIIVLLLAMLALLQLLASSTPKPTLAAPANTTITLGGGRITRSSPVAADLNGNGRKEIVVGASDGILYVVAYNGSSWNKVWETQTAQAINSVANKACPNQATGKIEASPAIGDIDNDGDLEIVIAVGGIPNGNDVSANRNGGIIAYELNSAVGTSWSFSVKSGWPFVMPDTMGTGAGASFPDGVCDGIRTTPSLGDIDGDGDLEIISMSFDREIRAFHHNGTVVAGWPINRASGDPILRGGQSSAAIADIDNDGLNEIVIGTNSPPWNGDDGTGPFPAIYNSPDYTKGTVWALNGDSSLVPGWPVITQQNIESSPAIGDIDGDGQLEIVVGTGLFDGYVNGNQVYAWNADGSLVTGWPRPTAEKMPSSPALADLDNNGVLDVIIGCGKDAQPFCRTLYAWNGSGNNLPGFPMSTTHAFPYPPVVADVDGDNNLEIVLNSLETSKVTVVQHNGSNGSTDISRATGQINQNAPLVDDVDNDGDLEIVIATANGSLQAAIYIFDEAASTTANFASLPWPMQQQNAAHTGTLEAPELSFVDELRFYHQTGTGTNAQLIRNIKNSGGGLFDWQINTSGTGGEVSVNLSSGTDLMANELVNLQFTVDTTGYTPNTWHNLGTISIQATVGGNNIDGSPQTVPVWLYVGDISQTYLPTTQR
ncbi:MAG: VCBS repeat-containing protein [Anaerolineales bacterium]|nr:VCBS repeat-containing protein [Anaerolineales bacterium]